ncbi:hypothetical protein [Streptomyces acidicola]|uniref:Secreted protein n=1 Tax=Streptomyces acidicola TaxID=2596892 RepID=A0A5N8X3V0_9ACTN|nr:hypothetical protein [Streptomyces acidicola]MPY53972.1 hypothetical protein [Streptomyces acidicola]
MRFRRTLVTAVLGGTLALGAAAVPAQAAPPQVAPAAQSAAATDSVQGDVSALASWHYSGQDFPSRSSCDWMANYYYNVEGIRGQCRGPYDGGTFELWLWY